VLADDVKDFVELLFREILRPHVGIETAFFHEQVGPRGTDAVDITEEYATFFLRGDFDTRSVACLVR